MRKALFRRGMRAWLVGVAVAVTPMGIAVVAAAEELRGVALVVGQSEYEHLPELPNPSRDARRIEELLNGLGIDADMVEDRDARRLKRDLDGFIDDAEGADIALLYYSGHGIEAGGQNWLIPVDADIGAAGDAGDRLVSLDEVIGQLRRKAKITVVLLDACRTNPFPPGTQLRQDDAPPAAIAAAGLGAPRGAVSLMAANDNENLGVVIGFAASPGEVALDGPEGGNSPYAAALLKHLGANDFAFGDVMTMVAEEVYLSTNNKQQPWVNASLRRLLYFGKTVEETEGEGDDAQIRDARRKLLMTISETPRETRTLVEMLASDDAVPLGALYGILEELQVDTSAGPDELARQLRVGADNLKRFMGERVAPARNDPELVRYAELAAKAEQEGAISLARQFRERASARADTLRTTLDSRETELEADRLEIAATYAEEAESAWIGFDYLKAAQRYGDAFDQAERWDRGLASRYKAAEGAALNIQGVDTGNRVMLEQSLAAQRLALTFVTREDDPLAWATAKHGIGRALTGLSQLQANARQLDEAIALFDEVLEVRTREAYPDDWANTQNAIGSAAMMYGHNFGDSAWLRRSAEAYRQAGEVLRASPVSWAIAEENRAQALYLIGYFTNDVATLKEALAAYEGSLREWNREDLASDWARFQGLMGATLLALAPLEPGVGHEEAAVTALAHAAKGVDRQRIPMDWARAQHYLAAAYLTRAFGTDALADYQQAEDAFMETLEVWSRDRGPIDWATSIVRMGEASERIALKTGDRARIDRALEGLREAEEIMRSAGFSHYDGYFVRRHESLNQSAASLR